MKSKHYLKLLFVLICFNLFTGCESDESFENSENIEEITLLPDHHDNLYSTRAIDIKDNPKLLEFLEKDVGRQQRNNNGGSAIITDFGEVPLDNIQQVIDTIGNVNYTFALRTNKQYENRFFNLVISQSSEDQSPTPYIVEYAMTPDFKERYNNEEVNMGSFTGFIRTYLLADFDDSVRNVNDCSELPIVVPISSSGSCGEEEMEDGSSDTNEGHGDPVDDGDTSGGGGTSGDGSGVGTGPSGNSSGSVTCNTSISTQSCSGCGCHFGTSTECTAGFKGSTTLTTSCSDGTVNVTEITIKNMRSSGCGPSGNMAIIPVPYKSLERVLNLTDSEADCLNENCDLKNQINQFVNQNEVTLNDPELAFANTVIDQLSDSCNMDFEVDFDEQIINTLTGKEKCLHDYFEQVGNGGISDLLSNFEGDNSEFSINITSVDNVIFTDPITGESREVNGKTRTQQGNQQIEIEISTSRANSRKALDVVRTLIHELIHAEMFRKNNTSSPTNSDLDFRLVYNSFEDHSWQPTQDHETMAELYIEVIANALSDYHRNIMVGDYNYLSNNGTISLEPFYNALAWRGLKNHNVQAYLDLSVQEKQALEDSFNQYYPATTSNCPN